MDAKPSASASQLAKHAKTAAELETYLDTAEGHANLIAWLTTHKGRAELETYLEESRAQIERGVAPAQWVTVLDAYFRTAKGRAQVKNALQTAIDSGQPSLGAAIRADAAIYARAMMDVLEPSSGLDLLRDVWRLCWATDAFFCLLLYRVRVRLLVRRIPLLPTFLHRVCMMLAQVNIGDCVTVEPGVILLHGQVVIDGFVLVGTGTVIAPWVTIGRRGRRINGPDVGAHTLIGTGAKLLGPIKIGEHAHVGANAVVISDVEPYGIAVGVPAKVVRSRVDDPDVVEMRKSVLTKMKSEQSSDR